MKLTRKYLWLTTFFSLVLIIPALCGDDPFSGQPISVRDTEYSPTTILELPPVKDGERVTGVVDVSTSLNIRTSPWGDIIGSFSPGNRVTITGQQGDWYKIDHNGQKAWVHSAYVLREGEKEKSFSRNGWVNAPLGLNVRRVPHGDIVGTVKDQRSVEILGVAGDYYKIKWGDNNEAFVSRRYVDTDMPTSPSQKIQPINFIGHVTASKGLNVRRAPWGAIDTAIPQGTSVRVTGKVDDWYQISFNGRTRFVHANYISDSSGQPAPAAARPTSRPLTGSEQQRIVQAANALVGSTRFRGREVNYGTLACAQVVSTALKNAGALDRVHLGVVNTINDLRSRGWREVNVPPYQEGDVITWQTYDRSGNGRHDPDTHIGIIVKQGNSYKAMHNSSRLRTPRITDPYFGSPISRVLRKV